MAWQDRLIQASFRGIPFFIENHTLDGGRNTKQHEPLQRNKSDSEDLGRKGRIYRMNAHVIGDDYFFIRDALIDAMEKEGKGLLVHPYFGLKEVQPAGYSEGESQEEGRMAVYSLTFEEAETISSPVAALDSVVSALTQIVAAVAIAKNFFQLAYDIQGLPGFVQTAMVAIGTDFKETVERATGKVSTDPQKKAELDEKLRTTFNEDSLEALVQNPASLANEIDFTLDLVKDVTAEPSDASTIDVTSGRDDKLAVLEPLLDFPLNGSFNEKTATRESEKTNAEAFQSMIIQLAVVKYAENAVLKQYKSEEEAINQREIIATTIESELIKEGVTDDVFQSLEDVNAGVVRSVPDPTDLLSNVNNIDLISSQPSLILTYDLYESLDNEQDIIDRNKIRNPAFINGQIQVLSG